MTDKDIGGSTRRTFLGTVSGIVGSTAVGTAAAVEGRDPDGNGGDSRDPGELIVGMEPTANAAETKATIQSGLPEGASVVGENDTLGYMEVQLPQQTGPQAQSAAKKDLENRPGVAYVEPNTTYYPMVIDVDDPQVGEQYAPELVNAGGAWETTFGSTDVTIGVVDQGTQYTHPDLEAQFGQVKGRDFVSDDDDPSPRGGNGHGTHVSGIAAGTTNNATGIAGISNSSLLAARALGGSGGGGTLSAIADAIVWCADNGADIINMSLGGGGASQTLRNACDYAFENGALPIAAAGNSGQRGVSYPAGFDSVVAVSAVGPNETLTDFSQYGPGVDVTAPGLNVLSTYPTDDYNSLSGTSMACPAAAGVASLALAIDPDLSPQELKDVLTESARDIGLPSDQQGSGLVDAGAIVDAVNDSDDGYTAPTATLSVDTTSPTVGDDVTFDASGSTDPDGSIDSFEWTLGDGTTASGPEVTHAYDSAGEYTATVTVTGPGGLTDSASETISVEDADGGGGSEYPQWDPNATYTSGDRVVYEGTIYEAQWWTQGDEPGSNQWGPWEEVGPANGGGDDGGDDGGDGGNGDDGGDDGNGDDGGDGGDSEYPQWDADTAYTGGDRVVYDGSVWEAQWWTQGDEPAEEKAVWERVS